MYTVYDLVHNHYIMIWFEYSKASENWKEYLLKSSDNEPKDRVLYCLTDKKSLDVDTNFDLFWNLLLHGKEITKQEFDKAVS